MAKRIVFSAPLVVGQLVTLQRDKTTKLLQVLGSDAIWCDASHLAITFDQHALEMTVADNGAGGSTAVVTGDALWIKE